MLEINIITFIGLLITGAKKIICNRVVKYFRFQAFTSIFFFIFLNWGRFRGVLRFIIIIKLGVAPFHLWIVRVAINCNFFLFFWLSTIQKIIPIKIISLSPFFFQIENLLVFSLLVRVSLLIHQIYLKKLLIYSSVYLNSWFISAINISCVVIWKFFFSYIILQLSFLSIRLLNIKLSFIKIINKTKNLSTQIFLFIVFLRGLPPSPIFFLKLNIIFRLINLNFNFLSFILIMFARFSIYGYINFIVYNLFNFTKSFLLKRLLNINIIDKSLFILI